MSFFGRMMKADKGGDRRADGKFVLGPVNSQKKRGEQAFDAAKAHLDDAAKSALSGDAEQANFHVNMAHQYASTGVQNHMMSDYLTKTKKSDDEQK
jgi:hypothetical protein